jgi:hypothetical protein
MTNRSFSAPMFSLTFGLGYAIAVSVNYPLFRYYPLVQRFSFHDLATTSLGPSMSWYGWIAIAALFAGIVTPLIPRRVAGRLPTAVFWIVLLAMLAAAGYRESEWFLVTV